MKPYDISKLNAELKSSGNVGYSIEIKKYYFVGGFRPRGYRKHIGYMVKVIYPIIIVGRRQVTVHFVN